MSHIPPPAYRFQSVKTKFFALSKPEDKSGQSVDTKDGKDSIPDDSVLFTNVPIGDGPGSTPVVITGVAGASLYVSHKEGDPLLTWSDQRFSWVVNFIDRDETGRSKYVIIPIGPDLYWFDEFGVGIGNHIAVRPGREIVPPQNEWYITPA